MKHAAVASAVILLTTLAAHAQDAGPALWEVGVFAGGVSASAYPGSSDRSSRALVLPTLIYRGEVFRADRSGFGARLLRSDTMELDVGFAASLPASSDALQARQGMPDLGTLIEFGPRLKWTLARPTPSSRLRLDLPLRSVLEIQGGVRDQGLAFEPTLVHEVRDIGGGWSLASSASLVYGDRRLNAYFYQVDGAYATTTRPGFDAQGGLIATRVGFSTSRSLTPDVRVFAFARFESYGGAANRASPLFQDSSGTALGLGLSWTLGRSAARAAD